MVEASFGAFLTLGGVINTIQEVIFTPQDVFGTGALVNWGLVIVGGTMIWRAASTIKHLESAQQASERAIQTSLQANNDLARAVERRIDEALAGLERRISAQERKWESWEPMMIKMAHRYGLDLERHDRDLA